MKRFANILFAFLAVLGLCACAKSTPTWQEQCDLGMKYLGEGNYEEAILAFTATIEIDPRQARAYVGRGDAYLLSGETEEILSSAQADYEKALSLDETYVDAYLGLADVYIRREDYDGILEILQNALEKTGSSAAILERISEIQERLAEIEQAAKEETEPAMDSKLEELLLMYQGLEYEYLENVPAVIINNDVEYRSEIDDMEQRAQAHVINGYSYSMYAVRFEEPIEFHLGDSTVSVQEAELIDPQEYAGLQLEYTEADSVYIGQPVLVSGVLHFSEENADGFYMIDDDYYYYCLNGPYGFRPYSLQFEDKSLNH